MAPQLRKAALFHQQMHKLCRDSNSEGHTRLHRCQFGTFSVQWPLHQHLTLLDLSRSVVIFTYVHKIPVEKARRAANTYKGALLLTVSQQSWLQNQLILLIMNMQIWVGQLAGFNWVCQFSYDWVKYHTYICKNGVFSGKNQFPYFNLQSLCNLLWSC